MTRIPPIYSVWAFGKHKCCHCKDERTKRCALLSYLGLETIPIEQAQAEGSLTNFRGPAIFVSWVCTRCIGQIMRDFDPDFFWEYAWTEITKGTAAVVQFDNPETKEQFGELFVQFTDSYTN